MSQDDTDRYIPALSYQRLTILFDPFVRLTMRELAFKRRLVEQARIAPGHRVFDLGCGTGTLIMLMKRMHPEAEVVGLDGDVSVLRTARRKAKRAGLAVSLGRGMAYELPYPDQCFDRVVSSLLFHHLSRENKRRTLAEVLRVLKPGGELHLADFGRPGNLAMHAVSLVMRRFEQARDNIEGLLPEMLSEAGFAPVEELARFNTLFGTLSLYRAVKPVA